MKETTKFIDMNGEEADVFQFYHKDCDGEEYKLTLTFVGGVTHMALTKEYIEWLKEIGFAWEGEYPKWVNVEEL